MGSSAWEKPIQGQYCNSPKITPHLGNSKFHSNLLSYLRSADLSFIPYLATFEEEAKTGSDGHPRNSKGLWYPLGSALMGVAMRSGEGHASSESHSEQGDSINQSIPKSSKPKTFAVVLEGWADNHQWGWKRRTGWRGAASPVATTSNGRRQCCCGNMNRLIRAWLWAKEP